MPARSPRIFSMLRSAEAKSPARRRGAAPIVLFTASRDWHARALSAAFAKRGSAVTVARLENVAFDTNSPAGFRIAGLQDLPRGVLVRTVSAGSFEAVTRRLGVLHALKRLN